MGIEWQAIIGAAVGIFIKHLFPGLIPSQTPATPAPVLTPQLPVNNTPKSNLEALLERLVLALEKKTAPPV